MKTVRQIETRLISYASDLKQATDQQRRAKIGSKIEFLKQMKFYLATEPRKEFLQNQIEELKRKLEIIDGRFFQWKAQRVGSEDDLRAQYRREMKVADIRKQIRTMEFILSDSWDE